jgi:hypothetical protein
VSFTLLRHTLASVRLAAITRCRGRDALDLVPPAQIPSEISDARSVSELQFAFN